MPVARQHVDRTPEEFDALLREEKKFFGAMLRGVLSFKQSLQKLSMTFIELSDSPVKVPKVQEGVRVNTELADNVVAMGGQSSASSSSALAAAPRQIAASAATSEEDSDGDVFLHLRMGM